jgi:hypothetical protein
MTRIEIATGQKIKAFNSSEWDKTGDIGNNEQFWQEAKVLKVYQKGYRWLVDVKFDNGLVSNGHFLDGVEKIK